MLAALDRSATMLPQPQGANATAGSSTGNDDQSVATAAASSGDAGAAVPAAMIAAFMTGGRALPALASAPPEESSDASMVAPSTSPAPKSPATPLSTVAAPMPALFTAIAAELRPALAAKADLAGVGREAMPEAAKDAPDSISTISPTSAMIRDLASMIATSVSPSAPADGVAVDRHLDLARGDAWLSDLASDIAATAANGGRLKFGLAPESLGRLDVEIRQGQAGVSVHMTTRTDTARDLLTAAQPRIVDEIRAQGVRVAGTEVSTDASGFSGDRTGNNPRQPLGLPIDIALSAPSVASPTAAESVADGRYA